MDKNTSPLLGDLSTEQFLNQYWQKKPCILRQVLNQSQTEILSIDELAGLALEENIESRLILGQLGNTNEKTTTEVLYGPFESETLTTLPEQDWTLLIQSVDIWHHGYQQILDWVNFLPRWRLDDIMVSIAAPGGGVGPHRDQYDVFLIQAQGQRRWQVSPPDNKADLELAGELLQVQPFQGEINEVIEAGDILYIPPGWRHWGVANSMSITCSIGFRAPSAKDLLISLSDVLVNSEAENNAELKSEKEPVRFTDPWRQLTPSKAISIEDVEEVRKNILALLNDDETLAEALGRQVTLPKFPLEDFEDETQTSINLISKDTKEVIIQLQPASRMSYFVVQNTLLVFLNGETLDCRLSMHFSSQIDQLCCHSQVEFNHLEHTQVDSVEWLQFLKKLQTLGAIQIINNIC